MKITSLVIHDKIRYPLRVWLKRKMQPAGMAKRNESYTFFDPFGGVSSAHALIINYNRIAKEGMSGWSFFLVVVAAVMTLIVKRG